VVRDCLWYAQPVWEEVVAEVMDFID
jgi:hypothetical protein